MVSREASLVEWRHTSKKGLVASPPGSSCRHALDWLVLVGWAEVDEALVRLLVAWLVVGSAVGRACLRVPGGVVVPGQVVEPVEQRRGVAVQKRQEVCRFGELVWLALSLPTQNLP